MRPVLTARNSESFKGCNDLHSPPMATSISPIRARPACTIPPGASFGLRRTGGSIALLTPASAPTAWCSIPAETVLFVAMTRDNAVWRVALHEGRQRLQGRPLLFDVRRQRSRWHDDGPGGPAVCGACLARPCLRVRAQRRIDRAHQILRRADLHQCRHRRREARPSLHDGIGDRHACWSRISVFWISSSIAVA